MPTQARPKLIIVDDDAILVDIVSQSLKRDFDFVHAEDGASCRRHLATAQPDAILLDIELPDIDGYQLCRDIRATTETSDIPIIMISAHDTLQDRITGYEAGADDYVTKPFTPEELHYKLKAALKRHHDTLNARNDYRFAFDTAMTAMSSSGEIGIVLNFLRSCFSSVTTRDLASLILQSCDEYGLRATTQLRTDHHVETLSNQGPVSNLEQEVIRRLASTDRIFDFGPRTVISFPRVSVLIKNMPLDDEARYGRIKDNIALLVEGADARAEILEVEQQAREQHKALRDLIKQTGEALGEMRSGYKMQRKAAVDIVDKLLRDLEASFLSLGLTEEQETKVMGMANNALNSLLELQDASRTSDRIIETLLTRLSAAADIITVAAEPTP